MASAATLAACSRFERVPIHFRCLGMGCDDVEYATETVKIWISGFLMKSRKVLPSGTILYLRLRVPTEISGALSASSVVWAELYRNMNWMTVP